MDANEKWDYILYGKFHLVNLGRTIEDLQIKDLKEAGQIEQFILNEVSNPILVQAQEEYNTWRKTNQSQ